MDGVSGVVAVVSLAIKLVDSVQEARSFLKDIQNAPNELVRIEETLDQLHSVLNYVRNLLEQQFITSRLPGTPTFILHGLRDCERKLEPLRRLVSDAKVSTNQRHRAHRAWASTKIASKKDNLQRLERQLRDAKSDLHFAVTGNLWQLQMQQLELTGIQLTETTKNYTSQNAQAGTVATSDDRGKESSSRGADLLVSRAYRETNKVWYSGLFGRVTVKKRAKHNTDPAYLKVFGSKSLAEETSIIIVPSIMRCLLELRLAYSLGKVSRSLNVYPVVTYDSPIIKMCLKGDMHGLQAAFCSGQISPFALDESGNTLLHRAASTSNVGLCSWLLGLGIDPNRRNYREYTALQWAVYGSQFNPSADIVDTIRLLAQTQELLSTADVKECAHGYRGPPQGVELILSKQCELEDGSAQGVTLGSAHHFVIAVRNYGTGNRAWGPLIRRLIRKGVDIHDRVSQPWISCSGPRGQIKYELSNTGNIVGYGTPLDELFRDSQDPSQSKELADAWLQILSSEGIDVQAYLTKEVAIHVAQNQLTWADRMFQRCRRLCYETGETPSVWWEWYHHPLSRIPLLQAEYREISFDIHDRELGKGFPASWQDRWPFDHPEWSDDPRMWEAPQSGHSRLKRSPELQEQYALAQKRADRRFVKRARKLARGQERRNRSQMPGTWIE